MLQTLLTFVASFGLGLLKIWMDSRAAQRSAEQRGIDVAVNAAREAADRKEDAYDEISSRGGYRRDELVDRLQHGSFGAPRPAGG